MFCGFMGVAWLFDGAHNGMGSYFMGFRAYYQSCETVEEEMMNDNTRSKLDCIGMFLLARHNTSRVTYGDVMQFIKRGECEK